MALRSHHVQLSQLREGEEILHNCTSHWFKHLKLPFLYLFSILLPFLAFFFLISSSVVSEESSTNVLWFLFSSYALAMTAYFFVRSVNFELGGCVITNQRVLRFGHKGLSQVVERDILPNKIEDVKVVKKGILSLFFDVADIHIYTSNNEIEKLINVIDSRKIQSIFSELLSKYGRGKVVSSQEAQPAQAEKHQSVWIDDALGESKGEVFDADAHREETIGQIGEVFRNPDDDK